MPRHFIRICVIKPLRCMYCFSPRWKLKCKKLERESERHQQATHSASEQNKVLGKEVENLRYSASSGSQQVEQMRRQLAELLAVRAQMDEQLRIRDVEVRKPNQAYKLYSSYISKMTHIIGHRHGTEKYSEVQIQVQYVNDTFTLFRN